MNAPLQLLYPQLIKLTEEYKLVSVYQLSKSYQPGGREFHDDWALFKSTPRIFNARRIPLPLRLDTGNCIKNWMPWDVNYPTVPGTPIKDIDGIPHALVDFGGPGWTTYSFWHHDHWEPCLSQYYGIKKLPWESVPRELKIYHGLKQDITLGDFMGWIEPACSFLPMKTNV